MVIKKMDTGMDHGISQHATSVKVALWCAPRSASTVLTKCLSGIEGMNVFLEFYSYAATCKGAFMKSTGRELPLELTGHEEVYEEASALWEKQVGYRIIPRRLSYQQIKEDLENTNSKYVLIKEMAVNTFDPIDVCLPTGFKHVFLIRDPSRVFASARKIAEWKLLETGLIRADTSYDMVRDDPIDARPMKWFKKQHELWKYVKDNIDPNPVVIDSFDLLSNPGPMLKGFCDLVGFPYTDDLLQWKPTTEQPSNIATVAEKVFQEMFEFYERAFKSTHFVAPKESGSIPRDQLTDDVIQCVDHSMPFYLEMFEHRLTV